MTNYHVATAAEAITAARFARLGYDVAVQYGANQPEYDLMVAKAARMLKISVKGSQTGSWGLTQRYIKEHGYLGAVDLWLSRHNPGTVFSLVQFKDVSVDEMPRIYLATPAEIAEQLRSAVGGTGNGILYENRTWGPRARAAGTTDRVPEDWSFSNERIDFLFNSVRHDDQREQRMALDDIDGNLDL